MDELKVRTEIENILFEFDNNEEDHPEKYIQQIIDVIKAIPIEPPVKPACGIERPQFRDYLPADTTTQTITDMFLANKELHRYIVALDEYIDELESKSV